MSPETYKAALEQAKKDLVDAKERRLKAIQEQDKAEQQIAQLRQTVAALSNLCGEEFKEIESDEFGLTDAIRFVLKTNPSYAFFPQDVTVKLEQMGFDTGKYKHLLPSVHTVLKRLALKGEVDDSVMREHKTAYRWSAMQPPPK